MMSAYIFWHNSVPSLTSKIVIPIIFSLVQCLYHYLICHQHRWLKQLQQGQKCYQKQNLILTDTYALAMSAVPKSELEFSYLIDELFPFMFFQKQDLLLNLKMIHFRNQMLMVKLSCFLFFEKVISLVATTARLKTIILQKRNQNFSFTDTILHFLFYQ